jgi:hypothetical protein
VSTYTIQPFLDGQDMPADLPSEPPARAGAPRLVDKVIHIGLAVGLDGKLAARKQSHTVGNWRGNLS